MRFFRNDAGEGTTLAGKLYITPQQRTAILKWGLYALGFLVVLVAQDVIFSAISLFSGTPCLTPAYILLVGFVEGPNRGGVFTMAASTFWAMSGLPLGSLSIVLLTLAAVFLGAFFRAYLRRDFWPLMGCCAAALLLHEGGIFLAGVFLKATTLSRWTGALVTLAFGAAACPVFYPVVRAISRIGGDTWTES